MMVCLSRRPVKRYVAGGAFLLSTCATRPPAHDFSDWTSGSASRRSRAHKAVNRSVRNGMPELEAMLVGGSEVDARP